MKKLLALFLVVAIMSQSLLNVGVSVYYHFNKAYITQQLCENKNNPAKHCNGRCYLSKQLKKAEESEKKQSQSLKEKHEQIISLENKAVPSFFACFRTIGLAHVFLNKKLPPHFTDSAIPPEVIG